MDNSELLYSRSEALYENTSQNFHIKDRQYSQQYCSLYFQRLASLKSKLREVSLARWNIKDNADEVAFPQFIRDTHAGLQNKYVLIGTLYKDMRLKPSALKEYSESNDIQPNLISYLSEDDFLILEDQTARLRIYGDAMNPQTFVSGMIVAILGILQTDGQFHVSDWCFTGIPRVIRSAPYGIKDEDLEKPSYVAFVSGLHIGETEMNSLSLQLLRDFLLGSCGSDEERALSASITRLIVAGNTFAASTTDVSALEEVDAFFAQLAPVLAVDLMPGLNDPTTYSLPQQPLHPVLFKQSRRLTTFKSTTNPYSFLVDKIRFTGTSGQPISDMCAFSSLNALDALCTTAECRCIAPTAPDTLPCYPFTKGDPFCIVDDATFPHVLFAGNQANFEHKFLPPTNYNRDDLKHDDSAIKNNVLMLCIPEFSKLPLAVLVNTRTLAVSSVEFNTS
ncbi:Dna polymerase epsilon subunit B protein [Cardiosporidium cionae]|uniref:Dna polymerase epsilon subunit B protein n=1 Tax=Cardiosporidium cionae TaxID=476202 RepID=A0ABQ7J7X7_9APIC|nr:Dna polymerase epsilon subunit B protein [Cardiosporidium cionae]|eukprot:KAF8819790.1 Dna polymerase epsilon subunit B protein [Cardiosporidium cionae]